MPLHPQARSYLDRMAALGNPPHHLAAVADSRRLMEDLTPALAGPAERVECDETHRIDGPAGKIRVRRWGPSAEESTATIVYFHGGGWVVGSPETHEVLCRALANRCNAQVIAPAYRRAPEHHYPAALDDAEAVVRWVADDAPRTGQSRIVVAGDSAGANLAAALTIRFRDAGTPRLSGQILLYPMLDHACRTPSFTECAAGYGLAAETARWYWDQYLADASVGDRPTASPLRSADLSGLPSAVVVTCEYDPLRSEGDEYACRLAAAGVATTNWQEAGMIHGFLRLPGTFTRAAVSLDRIAASMSAWVKN